MIPEKFLEEFKDRFFYLKDKFYDEHKKQPNVVFMSNNIYWSLLGVSRSVFIDDQKLREVMLKEHKKTISGLQVKILDAQEGDDEMYVGIIEE